ncbi:hypothetical protein IQ250_28225 [Pseudanabaenaceae cyanobacterium LEGE 13415]|nr:hypothetical protein [Pseudanabaenaceae cyanobacterium LEGE 13415]
MLDKLVILNFPHPAKFSQGLTTPQQLLKSWYVLFFQIPGLPEFLIQLDDYKVLESAFLGMAVNKDAFTKEDIEKYKDAMAKRGALTSTINYYRNAFESGIVGKNWGVLDIPTLIIWGEKDAALGKELTYGTEQYVKDFRIRYIPNCSHWVQQEQPELVNQYIREFI